MGLACTDSSSGFSSSDELDSTPCLHPSSSSPIQHPYPPKGRLIWGELASLSTGEPPCLKCWELKSERCERVEGTITPWPEKKNQRRVRLQQPAAGGLTSHTPALRSIRGLWWWRCVTHPCPHYGNLSGKFPFLWFMRMAGAAGLTRRPGSFSNHQKIKEWTQQTPKSTRQQRTWDQSGNHSGLIRTCWVCISADWLNVALSESYCSHTRYGDKIDPRHSTIHFLIPLKWDLTQ